MTSYTIEVRNLPQDTSEDDVRDFFSRVGDVTGCTLRNTSATLSFDNEEDFNEALNMDGMEFENGAILQVERKMAVEEMNQEATGGGKVAGANGATAAEGEEIMSRETRKNFSDEFKIAVRHLAENTTEQQLRELFEPLGAIGDLFLEPRRRYAFVGFDNAQSLEAALQMTGRELNGVAIEVEKKRTGLRENQLETKVVVRGLPPNTTEEDLRAFFASVGEPVDFFIHDKKHFAFIGFPNDATCNAALRLSGNEINGCRVDVERRQRQRCFKCNREGHVALQCRSHELTCRNCGRAGHVVRDCRAPPRDYRRNNFNNDRRDFDRRDYNNDRRDFVKRDYYDRRDIDKRDYNEKRDVDKREYNNRRDVERREDRRRGRSRSDSYDRHHRRRSRSRSRSVKRLARERDRSRSRSRSLSRRRY